MNTNAELLFTFCYTNNFSATERPM